MTQLLRPSVRAGLGSARLLLVGLGLVHQRHQQIAVEHRAGHRHQLLHADVEARVLLDALEAEGDHRDLGIARLGQGLAQKRHVIRRAAAAAGLEVDQRDLVRVVPAGLQGVDELADHQNRRVAGVVVHVLQPRGRDLRAGLVQQLHLVAVGAQHADDHLEVHGQHRGHEYGVVLLHFLREGNVIRVHITCPFPPMRPAGCASGCAPRRGW